MGKIYLRDDDDILDLCFDATFKAMLTKATPESRRALHGLLTAYLMRDIETVYVTANEPPINDIRNRRIRYDVNCKCTTGDLADVEMAMHPRAHEAKRLEYYEARLHASQDIMGKDKSYKDLKESFQIAFIANETLLRTAG